MNAGVSAETPVASATDERHECSLTVLHLDESRADGALLGSAR
jgi:hypothetical protein